MTEHTGDEATPVVPEPEPTDGADAAVHVVETPAEDAEGREPDPSTEQRTSAAVVPYERPHALVPGMDIPIIPAQDELRGLASMAVTLAGANAVPAALRNAPNDVFQVLLTSRDLGVAVTTAMREFHVIDGRVTLSPKVKLAMVNERGQRDGWAVWPDPANDAATATWYATRKDRPGLTFESTFTMAEARNVKNGSKTLADKDNWTSYPKRMLSWRALGYLLDDVFPEVGTGLYSPDEMGALTDEEGNPVIDLQVADPLPGTKAPKNHGPQAPDAGEQPLCEADPALCADLRARLDAIGTVPDARSALMALWTTGSGEGTAALPVFADLKVRHKTKAMAMIQSVEARLRKGDWGPWPADLLNLAPTDAQEPQDDTGGADAEPPSDAPAAQEAPPAAEDDPAGADCPTCGVAPGEAHLSGAHDFAKAMGDEDPPTETPPVDEAALAKQVVADVQALGKGAVVRELATRGFQGSRDDASNRRALGAVLLRERGATVEDHQMPPRLPEQEPDPQPQPLPLAPADRAAGERDDQ